jgi:hypothetical protein
MRSDAMKVPEAVVLCKYNESTDTATAETNARQLFLVGGSGTDNLFDYYAEMSYGQLDMSGSQIVGWYSMGSISDPAVSPTTNGRSALYSSCIAAARAADPSVVNPALSSAFRTLVVVDVDGADDGMGSSGVTIARDHLDTNYTAHEMSHAYGLKHSQNEALTYCGGPLGDYCDQWDEMSAQNNYAHYAPMPDRDGQAGANGFVAAQRMLLGKYLGKPLLAPSEIYEVPPATEVSVALSAVNRNEVTGTRVITVPLDATRYYTVELIRSSGWDIGAPATRVLVHLVDTGERVKIIPSSTVDGGYAVGMSVSRTGIRVVVDSIDETSSTAHVTITRP